MLHTLTDSELLFHLSLGRITFLSLEDKKKLSKNLDNFHSLVLLSIEDIFKILNRPINKRIIWNGEENLRMAKISLHYCKLFGIQILLYFDPKYPENLRNIADPPYLLFVRGNVDVLNGNNVSVVGTRKLTPNGKKSALQFAKDAALNGCNVVSGLAYGTDSCAHKGVLNAFYDCLDKNLDVSVLGKTIAVIPSAIDEIVPYLNKRLAEQIINCGGCIVSEYEPKMDMAKWHYVARNRLIAGMSEATVVIEAPVGSGALITADFALDYGRDLFFHESAFSSDAMLICDKVLGELKKGRADGHVSKQKLENTPRKYLEAGAPVIKDYKDYCIALKEVPGIRVKIPVQGELF